MPVPMRRAIPRIVLASLLWAAGARAATPLLYSVASPVSFDQLGIRGTIDAVTPAQAAGFDFSGSGLLSGASPGEHVCYDGVHFFDECTDTGDDVFAFSVTLDVGSNPLYEATLTIEQGAQSRWVGYIFDDDPATDEPEGKITRGNGSGLTFSDGSDPGNIGGYLQGGEATAVLLEGMQPGWVAIALAAGREMEVVVGAGSAHGGGTFLVPVSVTPVPEPGAVASLSLAMLALAILAKRARLVAAVVSAIPRGCEPEFESPIRVCTGKSDVLASIRTRDVASAQSRAPPRAAMRHRVVLLLALSLLGTSDPASDTPDPASEVVVVVSRQGFDPPAVEVPRGTIVAFHRRDPGEDRYRLVSKDGSFASWEFEEYTQWSHRFDKPGTYELLIERHPDVTIRVMVR